MKFEVGKKYKYESLGIAYECVYVSFADAVMRRPDGSHMVLKDDDIAHSYWKEVLEPREIWINRYSNGWGAVHHTRQSAEGVGPHCFETVKFREVLE